MKVRIVLNHPKKVIYEGTSDFYLLMSDYIVVKKVRYQRDRIETDMDKKLITIFVNT
jgi:hypothetical protein